MTYSKSALAIDMEKVHAWELGIAYTHCFYNEGLGSSIVASYVFMYYYYIMYVLSYADDYSAYYNVSLELLKMICTLFKHIPAYKCTGMSCSISSEPVAFQDVYSMYMHVHS